MMGGIAIFPEKKNDKCEALYSILKCYLLMHSQKANYMQKNPQGRETGTEWLMSGMKNNYS
jgi:hypothetical protein